MNAFFNAEKRRGTKSEDRSLDHSLVQNFLDFGRSSNFSLEGIWELLEKFSFLQILEPYATNITKRVVKSPKLFFVDTGLLCYLLRIDSAEHLIHSPFSGHIFENMVIIEKIKQFSEKGERSPCYFY